MTKRIERPTEARHIQIYTEDWNFLNDNFGKGSEKPLGAGKAIRLIVHKYCNAVRAQQIRGVDEIGTGLVTAAGAMARRMGETS